MSLDPQLVKLNKAALDHLRKEWQARQLTVAVGAGVSAQSGLPTWNRILDELTFMYVQNKLRKTIIGPIADEIRQHFQQRLEGQSPIIVAHYLRSMLTDNAFLPLVHASLYKRCPNQPTPGPIARAVARMTSKASGGLRAIITFNFDDLMELALKLENEPHTAVWLAKHWSQVNGLPVYHPHGYLPFTLKKSEPYWIVLSEADYHAQYATPSSWSNIAVSHALLESTCLFVSTSITDPNLRRMLDSSHATNPKKFHYFIWETPQPGSFPSGVGEIADKEFQQVFVDSYKRIGLKPVWFHYRGADPSGADPDYKWRDIPELLDWIRS